MVWKDHVNVLDQWRIFRLLAKGPRLEGYLAQLKRADKLDFASWGGFAQNFAGRRIPFENAAYSAYWNRAAGESLHIPTFATGASGPYLPATAIKGALRTGMVFAHWRDGMLQDALARVKSERVPRRPAEIVEEQALGPTGSNRMRFVGAGDSAPIAASRFQIYLLRTSTLQPRGGGALALGWKQSPRGAVDGARPEDSTPLFAEMAVPGTTFEGDWNEKTFFLEPEVRRSIRWPEVFNRAKIFEAVNVYAAGLLALQRQYAPGPVWACSTGVWTSWSNGSAAPAREAPVCSRWDGAPVSPPRAPGWMPATRITARSWSNSGSTIARWPRTCPSPRPAASSS